jgi:hypothetical protein
MAVGAAAAIDLDNRRVRDSDRRNHHGRLHGGRQAKSQRKSKNSFHHHYDALQPMPDRRSPKFPNARFARNSKVLFFVATRRRRVEVLGLAAENGSSSRDAMRLDWRLHPRLHGNRLDDFA